MCAYIFYPFEQNTWVDPQKLTLMLMLGMQPGQDQAESWCIWFWNWNLFRLRNLLRGSRLGKKKNKGFSSSSYKCCGDGSHYDFGYVFQFRTLITITS